MYIYHGNYDGENIEATAMEFIFFGPDHITYVNADEAWFEFVSYEFVTEDSLGFTLEVSPWDGGKYFL